MDRTSTSQSQEECEMMELSTKLSTLKEKGLISDVEYLEIVHSGPFVERQLLKLLFSKYRLQGANIWELFEVLTAEILVEVNNEDNRSLQHDNGGQNLQTINPLIEKNKNPLLINTIIRSVFGFLTFEEIKQYRLVFHQWDSTAQPFLRREGMIHFQPKTLKPSTFLEVFENNMPELPFTSFKFSNDGGKLLWPVSHLQMFVEKWGGNIKQLELFNICSWNQSQYDVTPWLEKATNLTKLTIKAHFGIDSNDRHDNLHGRPDTYTTLQVELDKLKSVQYLHLNGHKILVCLSNKNMIAPLEINLNDVPFQETELVGFGHNVNDAAMVRLNNYIDFSQAKNIILTPYVSNNTYYAIFDMANQNFNANNVLLKNMDIQNWNKAKGKIDCLSLFEMRLIERNELEIKKLIVNSCTIDMAIIQMTIEQILFVNNRTIIICDHSIVLPKLMFLGFKNVTQDSLNMLLNFAYCNNLTEIEIEKEIYPIDSLILPVGLIPKSVKRLKIKGDVKLISDENGVVRTLDKLISKQFCCEMTTFLDRVSKMLSNVFNLKVKVLVIDNTCTDVNFDDLASQYESVVINFFEANESLEKVIFDNVEFMYVNPLEQNMFLRGSGTESYCYEFEKNNTMRKSITKYQFSLWKSLNYLTMDY